MAVRAAAHRTPKLDSKSLTDRLVRVLQYALEHLPRLSCYASLSVWTENDEDDVVRMEDKVMAEAAILALVASRATAGGAVIQQLSESLASLLESICPHERYLGILLRLPDRAAPLGLTQIILAKFGRGNRGVQAVVSSLFDKDLIETVERIPYRAMEVRWMKSLLSPSCAPNVLNLVPLNVLAKPIHPIRMHRTTGYGATHSIMYATDFGLFPPPASLHLDVIAARIDAALAWVIANEDMDLLLEFLISATLLKRPWSPYAWAAWLMSTGVWDELGFIPSPGLDPVRVASLNGEEAQAYTFRHVYHTVFVAGLLCAILLATDRRFITETWSAPMLPTAHAVRACKAAVEKARTFTLSKAKPTKINDWTEAITRDSSQALRCFEGLLDAMLPTHAYARKFTSDSQIDFSDLTLVMGDAAIIHAARQYDFPKLLTGLNAMMREQRPFSLTVIEGTLFLVGQQLSDGCIGVQFIGRRERESSVAREATNVIADCLEAYAIRLGQNTN
jgi:hypothetical protein